MTFSCKKKKRRISKKSVKQSDSSYEALKLIKLYLKERNWAVCFVDRSPPLGVPLGISVDILSEIVVPDKFKADLKRLRLFVFVEGNICYVNPVLVATNRRATGGYFHAVNFNLADPSALSQVESAIILYLSGVGNCLMHILKGESVS